MTSRRLCLAGVLLALWPAATFAGTGSIVGTITAGLTATPIAGATIRLSGGPREEETASDAFGRYEFAGLDPSRRYTVRVEAEGLRTFTRSGLVVSDDEALHLDPQLVLIDARYSVLVKGAAVDARGTAPEVGRTVDEREVDELPTLTRSTTKYALLNPHARQVLGLGADFQDSQRLSINAGSYRHTGYMLDGAPTYDWIYANSPQVSVSPGAVREVQVLTGQYSAQYGLSTTGVVSIASASGGNNLLGDGFISVRPSGLQAKPPLSPFHVPNERVSTGFTIGGPLRSTRSQWFSSYEYADQNRGAFIQSPTPTFFNGDTREQYALVRVDSLLGSGHALTVRANAHEYTTTNANDRVSGFNQPSFGRRSHSESVGGQVTERAAFGAAMNEVRAAFVSYVPDSAEPLQTSVQIVRPNYSTEGFSTSNYVRARSIDVGELFLFTRGRQEIRLGGGLNWVKAHDYSTSPYGTYTFAPGVPQAGEHPLTYSQTFGTADLRYSQTQASAFVQDDIRLTPRVSMNLGLRYEVQSITDARLNFAPRVGAAWDVKGNGDTVVRGGAGVFYDQYYMYLTRRYMTLGPQSPQMSLTWSWGDPGFPQYPLSFAEPPTGKLAGARDIMIPGDTLLNPYSVQVSAGVEQQLGASLTLQVTGLYSHTYRQMRVNDINHPEPFARMLPNQVRTPQVANQSRPYATYDGVLVRDIAKIENTAETIYRSLDAGLTRRFSGWGQLSLHYLFSSSTAYSMFYADANSGVPNEWWPDFDAYERGPGDFHQPHRLVADGLVNLPYESALSFVLITASGLPVNPITGRDNNGDSYTIDRPIDLSRNSFQGPAQVNLDLALEKRFPVMSHGRVDLRFEVFNLLNRKNFTRVNNIYGEGPTPLGTFLAPVAGITNADPSRQLQFTVRTRF